MTEEKQLCMFAVPDNDKIGLFTFYKQQFNPANLDIPANAQLVDETHRQICVSQSQEDLQCNSRNTAKKTRKLSKRRRSENSLLTVSDQILSMDSLQFLSKVIRKNRAVNNLEIKKI